MNRLLRGNQFSRYVRRYDGQTTKSGGALTPVAVVVLGVGGAWAYNNREELFAKKTTEPKSEPKLGFSKKEEENRKDWEKFLPIDDKHRAKSTPEPEVAPVQEEEAAVEPEAEKPAENVEQISLAEQILEEVREEEVQQEEPVVEIVTPLVEEILEETVIPEAAPVPEPEVVVEEVLTEVVTQSPEVEDISPVDEAPLPEEPTEVVTETVEETSVPEEPIAEPEVAADPVAEVAAEPVAEPVAEPEVVAEPVVEAEPEPSPSQLMVQYSRAASGSTSAAIEAVGRVRAASAHYIAAKRVALGIDGDPDVRAAFWLQVTDAERRLQTATAELGTTSKAAEDDIKKLEELEARMDPDSNIVLISDIAGMKSEFCAAHESLAESNAQLETLARLENELESELKAKKEKYLEMLPPDETGAEDNRWRELSSTFTDEDLKGLIFIAQRKLETVARELRELKTIQQEEVEKALSTQREELLLRAENELSELKAKQEEMIINKKKELALELRNEFEEDLKLQLKRQSAAHAAHLDDELSTQTAVLADAAETKLKTEVTQLTQKYVEQINSERHTMTTSLQEQQNEYLTTLHQLMGYAEGVDLTLSEREKTEMEVGKLQCIILTVEQMQEAVMGVTITPLSEIASNFKNFGSDIPAVQAIIDSLPAEAVSNGVLSPKALERTLPGLLESSQCQFMVGDNAHGLFARLRSAVNSRVTSWSPPAPLPENADPTNIDQMFSAARHYMSFGDLESAVRVLNQTTGEPRRILAQWIHQARLSLEVKQALDALAAISQARLLSARSYS